jgi:hypothetical protein
MNILKKLLLATALVFALSAPVVACPLCKEGIPEAGRGEEDGHDPDRLSKAYNYSIFAFIGVPFSFVGVLGFGMYRIHRKETGEPK